MFTMTIVHIINSTTIKGLLLIQRLARDYRVLLYKRLFLLLVKLTVLTTRLFHQTFLLVTELRVVIKEHTFVGCVNKSFSLLQHQTKLYLVNNLHLT